MYDWEEDRRISDKPAVITNIIVTRMSEHYDSRSAASNNYQSYSVIAVDMHQRTYFKNELLTNFFKVALK